MKIGFLNNRLSLEAKIIAFILMALLLFDRGFSKMVIVGPVYAHDLLLLVATIVTILKINTKIYFPSLLLFIIISILYLIYSIFFVDSGRGGFLMVFRHYFLFFYLICCYIIFNKIFSKRENIDIGINFIIKIAKWSFVLQLCYFIYLFITVPNYSPLVGFSYFSAVGVMGIITYGAYILVYFNGLKRIVIFTIVLFVSMFLGHASSFFSLIAVFLVQFYISFTSKQRLITFFLVLVFMLILLQLPQFNDGNANWRLMYWSYIINNAIVENYLILGNGFGRPFMSMSFAQQILDEIGSFNMLGNNNPLVRWESPPHNSFLTIIFHIGLIPAMLLLFPIKSLFKQILLQNKSKDKKKLFLLYCLVGSVVWASFNVVLELPHSAVYFWLIYFTYAFYERKQTKI